MKTSVAIGALFFGLCSACGGGGDGGSSPPPAPPSITTFTASETVVERGASIDLTATFVGVDAFVNQGVGPVESGVPITVNPDVDTTYTLSVVGEDGTTAHAEVLVRAYDFVFVVRTVADSGPFSLREAILDASAVAPGEAAIAFDLPLPATLTQTIDLPALSGDVAIVGPGAPADLTVSGGGTRRVFFVAGGRATFSNLTIAGGLAQGGTGGRGIGAGGGGAAGMGGGLFVNDGDVRLEDVVLSGNSAVGGAGGTTTNTGGPTHGGGGGGIGGNGSDAVGSDGGAGGSGGILGGAGGLGGVNGGASATAGGEGAGGGGGSNNSGTGAGAAGGFGGGGGAGGFGVSAPGGFGGGGGGSDPGGATGGVFAGTGGTDGGGGGGGLGGGIFVRAGRLSLVRVHFESNAATAGAGGAGGIFMGTPGGPGQGKGGALFMIGIAEVTGTDLTFSANAASDDSATPGDDDDVYGSIVTP
jgi:hypothetical protein